MVEYFLTENLLSHFNRILQQRSNRRGNVATQVGARLGWRSGRVHQGGQLGEGEGGRSPACCLRRLRSWQA